MRLRVGMMLTYTTEEHTNTQMATQRLGEPEKKILEATTAMNRSPLRRERIQLGVDTSETGGDSVQIAGFVFTMFYVVLEPSSHSSLPL